MCADEPLRLLCEGATDEHIIGFLQQILQPLRPSHCICDAVTLPGMTRQGENPHPECLGSLGGGAADAAVADYAEGCAFEI